MNARVLDECVVCSKPIEGAGVEKTRRGVPCSLHAACWDLVLAEQTSANARRLEIAKNSVTRSFLYQAKHEHCEQTVGGLPDWPHARFDNPEFRRRASKKILTFLESYSFTDGTSVVVSGDTGAGKTGGVEAMLYKWLDEARSAIKSGPDDDKWPGFRPSFFFVSGHELVGARRNWKIGSEAPIVTEAKKTGLLILDELGFEPSSDLPFEVIDHRYRQRLVTIVTTGRKPNEFRDRYGDAMYRRLTEEGILIEDW